VQKYLKLLILLAFSLSVNAQQPFRLKLIWPTTNQAQLVQKNVDYNSFITDSLVFAATIKSIVLQCNELSFLTASISSIQLIKDTALVNISLGNSYKWVKLTKGNVPLDVLSAAGFREQQFIDKTFNPKQFTKTAERILQFLENNGYPFASIKLDSVEADSVGIAATMNLQMNEYIVFDTIEVLGEANIKKWFLYKYLGIKPSSNYNENTFAQINSRLSQLSFLRTTRPSATYFFASKAMPIVYLENRQASSIDGIVGFAPNTQSGGASAGRLLLTGEANLRLQNIAGTGKSFDLNYRSFLGNSQDLHLKFVFPYIFRTNIALDYDLSLIKQDTSFLDVKNEIGIQYRFIGNDYFKVFYQVQSTTLITIDTNQLKASRSLPTSSDIRNNTYGVGFKITRYDYFLNPRSGFSADLTSGIGIKNILKNPTIEQLRFLNPDGSFASLYDTIQLRSIQYRFQATADYFIPLFQRATLRVQASGGHIVAQNLFINELFRIGGIRSLRGFDEQAIFASTFAIVNTELRYILQQNSNVMLFWNGAFYQNVIRQPVIIDRPFGFGAGFNFETGAGIFSIFYAVGKEFANPINLSRAKVHFGFVNYF